MQNNAERWSRATSWVKEHLSGELHPVTVASVYWNSDQVNSSDSCIPGLIDVLRNIAAGTGCEINDQYIPTGVITVGGEFMDAHSYIHVVEIHRGKNMNVRGFLDGLTAINMKIFSLLREKGIKANDPARVADPNDRLLLDAFTMLTKNCQHRAESLPN
jgi:hypothetical protein